MATGSRLRLLAAPVAALAGFVLLAALVAADWAPLDAADRAVSARAREYGGVRPAWGAVWRIVTHAGSGVLVAAFGAGLTAALLVRRAYTRTALVVIILLATEVGRLAVRSTLGRLRPEGGFVGVSGFAFPSGHTTHATTMALLTVLLIWPRLGRVGRWVAVVGAVTWAGVVGVSRVVLVVHWPSDVVGGWLLAVGLVPLVAVLVRAGAARLRRSAA